MAYLYNVSVTLANGAKITLPEVAPETLRAVVDPAAAAAAAPDRLYSNMPALTFPDDDMRVMVEALCAAHRRIPAIKLVRAIYALGLKEAKAWVDERFPSERYRDLPF